MTVYSALVISLVLVPMLFFALDVASLMYYKAKAQNLADAAALTAVKDTNNWHIPIPDFRETIYGIPYNGWFFNTLTLKNVKTSFPSLDLATGKFKVAESEMEPGPMEKLLALNKDRSWGKENRLTLGQIQAVPGNFISPVIAVRAPVSAEVPVYTPFLAKAVASGTPGKGGTDKVTVTAEACAMAWYRPDRIVHGWWTAETLDALFDIPGNEPLKYYKAINCPHGAWDVAQLLEAPLTEWFFTRYGKEEGQKKLEEWMLENGERALDQMKGKNGYEKGNACSDDCGGKQVDRHTDRTWDECHQSWSTCQEDLENEGKEKEAEAKRKAEEEAKRQAEEAAKKAP